MTSKAFERYWRYQEPVKNMLNQAFEAGVSDERHRMIAVITAYTPDYIIKHWPDSVKLLDHILTTMREEERA